MSLKFRLTKASALLLAVTVTFAGVTGMSVSELRAETDEPETAVTGYSVPSAGMSAVLTDFCDFSQGSGVEYLATTVVASSESVSEYVNESGSLLGKYIVCIADDFTYLYTSADDSGQPAAKIYTNGVATLIELGLEWCQVISDGVEGYVKTSDFVFGELAEELDSETYVDTASVTEDDLYMYTEEETDSTVVCVLQSGSSYEIVEEDTGTGYTKISIDGVGEGYVETESIESSTERIYAVTIEEEEAEAEATEEGIAAAEAIEEEKAAEEAARIAAEEEAARIAAEEEAAAEAAAEEAAAQAAAEEAAAEAAAAKAAEEAAAAKAAAAAAAAAESSSSSSSSSSASALRQELVEYACSFIGVLPYKYGGSSLTSGVDCSGFVMAIYAHFGYSLPHSSYSMRSVGTEVSYSDIQPGDIVCYSGHVGIYIGSGLIVNAPQSGETVSTKSVNYKTIITIRRVIS